MWSRIVAKGFGGTCCVAMSLPTTSALPWKHETLRTESMPEAVVYTKGNLPNHHDMSSSLAFKRMSSSAWVLIVSKIENHYPACPHIRSNRVTVPSDKPLNTIKRLSYPISIISLSPHFRVMAIIDIATVYTTNVAEKSAKTVAKNTYAPWTVKIHVG